MGVAASSCPTKGRQKNHYQSWLHEKAHCQSQDLYGVHDHAFSGLSSHFVRLIASLLQYA